MSIQNKRSSMVFSFLLIGVIAIVYHLLLFLFKKHFVATSWIAYAFTMLSFIILLADLAFSSKKLKKLPMFGAALSVLTGIYFLSQLVAGLALMFLNTLAWQIALLIEVLLLSVYAGTMAVILHHHRLVSGQNEVTKAKVGYINMLNNELQSLLTLCREEALRQKILKLIEEVRFSDPISHPDLDHLEWRIRTNVDMLRDEIGSSDTEAANQRIQTLLFMIDERNRLCLMFKS